TYDVVHPPADVAVELALDAGAYVVRRKYVRQHAEGAGVSTATSYLPYELVSPNPKLLDANNEPWAGGTIHQLSTVGIEIDQITDYVTATMATRDEQAEQDIPPGTPVIRIRKISTATTGRPVEVTDIPAPADRTTLIYTTQLERWS